MSARRAPPLLPWMLAAVALAVAAVVPLAAAQRGRVTVVRDVAYAPADPAGSRGHLLDLWLPPGGHAGAARRPLLVWSGGSGWLSDAGKDSAEPIARYFTARGYAVAGVSVRSSGQAVFPAQLHDVKAAVRWLRHHAGELGLDPVRFATWGESAGGHLASLVALTGDDPALRGDLGVLGASDAVQAAVVWYGPSNLLSMAEQNHPDGLQDHNAPDSPESLLVGGPVQQRPHESTAASPVTYASAGAPPTLLVHGEEDRIVPHGQSEELHTRLTEAGARSELRIVPGADHCFLGVDAGPLVDEGIEFLNRALGG